LRTKTTTDQTMAGHTASGALINARNRARGGSLDEANEAKAVTPIITQRHSVASTWV
jgi:hypothetical protein